MLFEFLREAELLILTRTDVSNVFFFNRIPILLDKLKRKHNKTAKLEIEDLNYRLTYLFSHNENKIL